MARHGSRRARRIGRWETWWDKLLWWVLAPGLALAILYYTPPDLGEAYRARFGDGTPGTFTTTRKDCGGRGGCTSYGDFVGDDGSVRRDVLLASGGGDPDIGETVRAVDTGASKAVYPSSGGWDWLIMTVLVLAALGYVIYLAVTVYRRFGGTG